jgi:hypothetical protein
MRLRCRLQFMHGIVRQRLVIYFGQQQLRKLRTLVLDRRKLHRRHVHEAAVRIFAEFAFSTLINERLRMRYFVLACLLAFAAVPMFGEVQVYSYSMPCGALWPAVKDTVRNSGNYATVLLDDAEMVASFAIGVGDGFRIESAILNPTDSGCTLRISHLYQPGLANDAGDFQKRLDKKLSVLKPPPHGSK